MKKYIKVVAVVLSFITGFILSDGVSVAKTFSLSPMSQKVVLVPGETYRGSISVSNPASSTEGFDFEVTVAPFYPSKINDNSKDDYETANYVTKTNMNMIADWTTVENPTGTLVPNEEKVISFVIVVPKDAPAGGQYMALLVGEDVSKKPTNGDVSIKEKMQMAHVVYAEVAGETRNIGSILENNVPSFSTSNVFKTSAMVRNDGNIHAEVKYILQVWPLFSDEEICTNEENPEDTMVLPNTKKYYSQECNLPMIGIFRAKQTVKIFGEESIVEKTIIVCPLWLIFVIIFGIVFLIAWLVARSKKRSSRSDD